MNDAAVKASVALIPVGALFTGATIIFVRRRSMSSFLQLVGAAGLVAVILTHVFEGLRVFPRMGWGSQHSVGHYLDLLSAILAVTLFSLGYVIHAVNARERERERGNCTRASGPIAKLSCVIAPQATLTAARSLHAPARMPSSSLPQF